MTCLVWTFGGSATAGTPAEEQQRQVEFHMKDIAGQINVANTSKTDAFRTSYLQGALADIDRLLAAIADAQHKHTWIAGLKYHVGGQVATEADVIASLQQSRAQISAALAPQHGKPAPPHASAPAPAPSSAPRPKGGGCVKKNQSCANNEECCDGHEGGPMICDVFGLESTTCGPCRKRGAGCSVDGECCGYKFGDHDGPQCIDDHCGHCYPKGHRCQTVDSTLCNGYCCSGNSKQVSPKHGSTYNVCE
jgi:hypothetical protein